MSEIPVKKFIKNRCGVVISAPKSGSGKTIITCTLIRALLNRHVDVCSYKCGPDYIDPMFHRNVLGTTGGNLDTFFTGEEKTREIFLNSTTRESFAVVEGVMGLFDGVGGIQKAGSTYHLASTLGFPVILIIDAKGAGRSVLPLISGFLSYDINKCISGVILNRVSASYYPVLKNIIEAELATEVLGYFPEQKNMHIESRHLGLVMPDEIRGIKEQVAYAAAEFEQTADIEKILEIGSQNVCEDHFAEDEKEFNSGFFGRKTQEKKKVISDLQKENRIKSKSRGTEGPVLAVARDEAFCFYYRENIDALKDEGFQIREFSPIRDRRLPDGTSAILFGGGYPELFAKELSENEAMKDTVRSAISSGMPSVAECGGFMYLHTSITDDKNRTYKMVGAMKGSCTYMGHPVRFGYVIITEKEPNFIMGGEAVNGHEFHYYDSTDNGNSCTAKKPFGKKTWDCISESRTHWWGFPHLYYPSNPGFVKHLYIEACRYASLREQVKGNNGKDHKYAE